MKSFQLLMCLALSIDAWAQVANPRHPAEWEEVSAVLMEADLQMAFPTLWDEAIDPFIKVAQACIDEEVDFYVIDPDTGGNWGQTQFVNMDTVFSNRGLVSPLIHVIHVNKPFDIFPWARDNGPFSIYEDQVGTLYFGGFNEDSAAAFFSQYVSGNFINLPRINTDPFYYDGGNWLTDGHGTFNICNTTASSFANGLVQPPIQSFAYLGSQKTLNVTGVDVHADYWLKLINEETFVIGFLPPSNYVDDPRGYQNHQAFIDSGVTDIKAYLQSACGRSFKFYPIQNAPSFDEVTINTTYFTEVASYTNSLIINRTVLVPQYTYEPYDSIALKSYREIMPGYKVVGVNCRQYAVGAGGLHCITHEIYADNPIYIRHAWLPDSLNQITDYQIEATIISTGGIASASVFWTADTSTGFDEIAMASTGNDNYRAFIPGQSYGTTIYYYVSATNNNGKIISKPIVAPDGYFKTLIDAGGVTRLPEETIVEIPREFTLSQNYPNPFNPITTITFSLPRSGHAKLQIFNVAGERARILIDQKYGGGTYSVVWDGTNDRGDLQSTGIYFYQLKVEDKFIQTKQMLLLR
jgi:agmatine deiminase